MKIVLVLLSFFAANMSFSQIKEIQKSSDKAQERIALPPVHYFPKTPFVDPFIGTGGHGHTYPGASSPFGMIQLSPDTRPDGWDGCSGYHYSDSIIFGFSHTHLSGTGVPDYCDLLIMPQSGKPNIDPLYKSKKGFVQPSRKAVAKYRMWRQRCLCV